MDPVPGFPPHASPPARRLATLATFRARGIPTQATISPLLPLADPQAFARRLDAACDRVDPRPLPDRRRLAERLADPADQLPRAAERRPGSASGTTWPSSGRSATCWPACWERAASWSAARASMRWAAGDGRRQLDPPAEPMQDESARYSDNRAVPHLLSGRSWYALDEETESDPVQGDAFQEGRSGPRPDPGGRAEPGRQAGHGRDPGRAPATLRHRGRVLRRRRGPRGWGPDPAGPGPPDRGLHPRTQGPVPPVQRHRCRLSRVYGVSAPSDSLAKSSRKFHVFRNAAQSIPVPLGAAHHARIRSKS